MRRIIGIDLGTSTSEAAILKNGKPVIIPNLLGNKITPSVVYISDEGEIKVGEDAQSYTVLEPSNTAIEVKRLMGSKSSLPMGNKSMKPQEVSACILRYLKRSAESYLGEEVEEAVITVPAYFTNEQRVATKEAGELAGFKVERIINEPTAAALAYGLEHMTDQKYILVYDLGGGTLDVTVLEMFEGVLDVKASSGNNALGGKDFDEALINKLVEDFKKANKIDLKNDRKALARLKEASERAKIELSSKEVSVIDLPFLSSVKGKPVEIHREITRKDFEKLIGDMVYSTLKAIDTAILDAGIKIDEIETILLVGGSTKIPIVKNILKEKFGREPLHEVNPDEAVALGAAIQAGIMSGDLSGSDDIIITDVCPYTLGIECVKEIHGVDIRGMFDVIIERNTTIPVSNQNRYYTTVDNQVKIRVKVYQGDEVFARQNKFLGDFLLEGIPPKLAEEESMDVDFSYDINGILNVRATITSTGKEAGIVIDTRNVEIQEEIDVEKNWQKSKYAKKVKALISKGEKIINSGTVNDEFKVDYRTVLYELKYALCKNDEFFIKRYEEELTDLLYDREG